MALFRSGEDAPSDREQAELIRGLYANTPVGVGGALFGVLVLCWVLLDIAPERAPRVWAWLGVTLASVGWQLMLWAWHRSSADQAEAWRPWARRFVGASLIEGLRWGAATVWLPAPGAAEQQLWVTMVVACAASSSVSSLGSYLPAFYALLIPAAAPIVLLGWFHPEPRYWAMSLLAVVLPVTIGWLGLQQNRSLRNALRLRFDNADLAERLGRQKEIADRASVSKSRFLAAASHDLRQPIHALGLFVGVLREERIPPPAHRLVDQMGESVQAMQELCDGLLDLSQLDADAVRPRPSSFPLDPLLERICREQAVDLEAKPLRLRRVKTSVIVEADPVLLERMVRNLITNAVRHSSEGRVLVGCRRGVRARIEVWDTGPGIAEADRERIFEEYIQLANPDRDRNRGLGLGLAVTRRLGELLQCPISFDSRVGAGSVFRISAPRAAPGEPPSPAAAPAALSASGLILVVDDDAAVREGTAQLLRRWGFEVIAAGSGRELLGLLEPGRRPDLIICDWRLRGRERAADVIGAVRAACRTDLPGLLITGETGPAGPGGSNSRGLTVLHKPIPPGKLRAAIGYLLGAGIVRTDGAGGSVVLE